MISFVLEGLLYVNIVTFHFLPLIWIIIMNKNASCFPLSVQLPHQVPFSHVSFDNLILSQSSHHMMKVNGIETKGCGALIPRGGMSTHLDICPKASTPCALATYGCTARVLREDAPTHMARATSDHLAIVMAKVHEQSQLITTMAKQLNDLSGFPNPIYPPRIYLSSFSFSLNCRCQKV
jgi:hypothetical protein